MSVPKINVILEEEIIMYEDDQRLSWSDGRVLLIKIDDYGYREGYNDGWLYSRVESLEDAKIAVRDCGKFNFNAFCNYCGGDVIGEMEVFVRKITIYKRPPKGAKDMKIKASYPPYIQAIYRVGTRASYCKKCGSTDFNKLIYG